MMTTRRGVSKPLAVTRTGPKRAVVSAPFLKSSASLKKLVATWMSMALSKAHSVNTGDHVPVRFQASIDPAQTGTMAAGSVLGRDARNQGRRESGRFSRSGRAQQRNTMPKAGG